MAKNIVVYSTPSCVYCKMVKGYLKNKDISFQEYNVAEDTERRQEMIEKSGQLGVPVTDIDGKIIVGFDKLTLDMTLGA